MKYIKIGINYKGILMTDKKSGTILRNIDMKDFNYFISGKSIYFMTEDIKYRFDGLILN